MMKKIMIQMIGMVLFFLPTSILFAWQWTDLWRTADQQGDKLLRAGKAHEAAQVFKNQNWQAVALYRAENYAQALQQFNRQKTSDGQYNAGNAAAHLGRYQEAIDAYDKAIALNSRNTDAMTNREIIKKLMQNKNQQSKSCSSNNSSNSSAKNEPKNTESKSTSNSSSAQNQSPAQNNSSQNNSQKDIAQNTKSQQSMNNSPPSPGNSAQTAPENKALDSKQEKMSAAAHDPWQAEDKNQLLRRLPDDPGGLLRQKFLRDYLRLHSDAIPEGYTDEGGN